jgi:hypothetical protein
MRRSFLLLSLGLATALSDDPEIVPEGTIRSVTSLTAATLPDFEFPTVPEDSSNAAAKAAGHDGGTANRLRNTYSGDTTSFDDNVPGEEDDAVREATTIDAATTQGAGVVLDAVDVPSFQDATRAGSLLPRNSDETRGFDVTMLAVYDHQVEKNRQVIAASVSIDKDMKARLEKTTQMLLPLRKSLKELSEREHYLQKRLQTLKLQAKRAKIEEMKAQLQKDEAAHEVEEAALARQKAEHDKHLAEIAKHLSVLNAEEQGAIPADEGEDEDEDEDEGEDEDVPEHNKEADAADPSGSDEEDAEVDGCVAALRHAVNRASISASRFAKASRRAASSASRRASRSLAS